MATTENTSAEKPTVDEIQADIEQTRAELGETIEALGAKMDVKTRMRNKAAELKVAATDDAGKPLPGVIAGAAGAVAVLVVLLVWQQRR